MLNIIPSNRQEFLLQVLIHCIQQDYTTGELDVFTASTVVVESKGMQHYINLGIAEHCGVSMNIDYLLVSACIYQRCREILGADAVPKESPFTREVMVWRIFAILSDTTFQADPASTFANQYWQQSTNSEQAKFNLAQASADVFEQYMRFRPEWLDAWEKGQTVSEQASLEPWQALIWQHLLKAFGSDYPGRIIERAKAAFRMGEYQNLPKKLYIFAVNALSPQQIEFFELLSQRIDIYFFHLNPCVEYWADLRSEKAALRQKIQQGLDNLCDESSANPLLANLGQQGRVLFGQLQQFEYPDPQDFNLFSDPTQQISDDMTLLQAVQYDLFKATVGAKQPNQQNDHSISVHSCHSPLREVQVLHQELLQIMYQQPDIKPHDIIVLCPAVEDYAPYVPSVFRELYSDSDPNDPRLVCSIADRTPLDAEPMVNMFMDMLKLPESRFSVTALIDYLQIPAVHKRFELDSTELEICQEWVKQAAIYWAKDHAHKAEFSDNAQVSDRFTWSWGLSRLLKSALHADNPNSDLSFALLDCVEGQAMQTLGKLIHFISSIDKIHQALAQTRSLSAWLTFLQQDILQVLFNDDNNDRVLAQIKFALAQLSQHGKRAEYDDNISLAVIQEAVTGLLSKPDRINQFNTGQVTFSSMVPMRSVPFKVVCMLGLNDGVFPRANVSLGIDLLANIPPRITDRSRRHEDRYMFLEAIMSARQYLYLSYQGVSIGSNSEREPSLVLRELMDYITNTFDRKLVSQHKLQPFNPENFAKAPAIISPWSRLINQAPSVNTLIVTAPDLPNYIDVEELAKVFEDPLAAFATQHLNLHFERFQDVQSDVEPFELDALQQSILRNHLLTSLVSRDADAFNKQINNLYMHGRIPESSIHTAKYQQALSQALSDETVLESGFSDATDKRYRVKLNINAKPLHVIATMATNEQHDSQICDLANSKAKHIFAFYLQHAVKRLSLGRPVSSEMHYVDGAKFKEALKALQKHAKPLNITKLHQSIVLDDSCFDESRCEQLLSIVIEMYQQVLAQANIMHLAIGAATGDLEAAARKYIADNITDPYIQYFFGDQFSSQVELPAAAIASLNRLYREALPEGWLAK